MTGPVATRMVLSDPSVDVAVLEIARGGLLRAGMGVRHCDVGAVLNVKADHLGPPRHRYAGAAGAGEADRGRGGARTPRCSTPTTRSASRWPTTPRRSTSATSPWTRPTSWCGSTSRRAAAGVVLESGIKGQMITIYDHGAHIPLLWTHLIPATLEGRAMHNVQNAMFAAAMAFSMGLKLEDIRHGLRTFDTTFFQAPGRMNIYDEHPFKVILDYGHNPAAVEVDVRPGGAARGRRDGGSCVLSAPGDRRDEDIHDIGRIAAGRFDRYICRRDDQPARPEAGRGARTCCARRCWRTACRPTQIAVIPDEQAGGRRRAPRGAAGDLRADLRGRHHPQLEAGDPVPPRGDGRPGRAHAHLAAGAGARDRRARVGRGAPAGTGAGCPGRSAPRESDD